MCLSRFRQDQESVNLPSETVSSEDVSMSRNMRSLGHVQAEVDGEADPTDSAALGDTKIADGVQCPVLLFYRILVLEILILAKAVCQAP